MTPSCLAADHSSISASSSSTVFFAGAHLRDAALSCRSFAFRFAVRFGPFLSTCLTETGPVRRPLLMVPNLTPPLDTCQSYFYAQTMQTVRDEYNVLTLPAGYRVSEAVGGSSPFASSSQPHCGPRTEMQGQVLFFQITVEAQFE